MNLFYKMLKSPVILLFNILVIIFRIFSVVETEERAMSLVQAPIFHRIQSSSTSSLVNNMATQQQQQQLPQQNSHQQSRSMNHDALNTLPMSYGNHGHQVHILYFLQKILRFTTK